MIQGGNILSKLDRLAFISADGGVVLGIMLLQLASQGKKDSPLLFRVIGFHFSYSYLQYCLCSA